jgi:hypothetical protein
MAITIERGITIGGGITIGDGGNAPAGTGSITFAEMPPPVVPTIALQDPTATVNSPTGFTINNGALTGVLVQELSSNNITFFNNLGLGTYTATLGAGSTYPTISVNIANIPSGNPGNALVFFFNSAVSYPATFNYPFTIS